MTTSPATAISERYVLHDRIASGGMASVHLGRARGPAGFARTVAIKCLHAHLAEDPVWAAALVDEARIAARLHHPNVVATLDVVSAGTDIYLVLEYAHAISLAALAPPGAHKSPSPSPRVAVAIVLGVLSGLHAAHEARDEQGRALEIVHRDVAPANILVGEDGVPRIIDFGIARARGRLQGTRRGLVKGTLSYTAPEQVSGGAVTRQADIYGAGVVLWELLTGLRLFKGEEEAWILEQIRLGWVDPPSKFVPDLPEALDQTVLRALQTDPSQRFASAREMALALEQAISPASPSEVGAWVAALGHEALALREARIAQIEAEESASRAAAQLVASSTGPGSSTRSMIMLAAVVLMLGLTGLAWGVRSSEQTTKADVETPLRSALARPGAHFERAVSASPSAPVATAHAVQVPAPAPVAPESGAGISPAKAMASKAPPAKRPVHGVLARPMARHDGPRRSETLDSAASSASLPDCTPPYVIDEQGILRYKRACLQ
jgi:hypothetical protein